MGLGIGSNVNPIKSKYHYLILIKKEINKMEFCTISRMVDMLNKCKKMYGDIPILLLTDGNLSPTRSVIAMKIFEKDTEEEQFVVTIGNEIYTNSEENKDKI